MSFVSLNKDELADIADFFMKDVVAAKDEPTKKELIAALATGDPEDSNEGERPVTWEAYNEVYLPAKTRAVPAPVVEVPQASPVAVSDEDVDKSEWQLVKMERKNFAYEVYGLIFTKEHPFHSVPPETAWKLIKEQEGFRLAMPNEVTDYYN